MSFPDACVAASPWLVGIAGSFIVLLILIITHHFPNIIAHSACSSHKPQRWPKFALFIPLGSLRQSASSGEQARLERQLKELQRGRTKLLEASEASEQQVKDCSAREWSRVQLQQIFCRVTIFWSLKRFVTFLSSWGCRVSIEDLNRTEHIIQPWEIAGLTATPPFRAFEDWCLNASVGHSSQGHRGSNQGLVGEDDHFTLNFWLWTPLKRVMGCFRVLCV